MYIDIINYHIVGKIKLLNLVVYLQNAILMGCNLTDCSSTLCFHEIMDVFEVKFRAWSIMFYTRMTPFIREIYNAKERKQMSKILML